MSELSPSTQLQWETIKVSLHRSVVPPLLNHFSHFRPYPSPVSSVCTLLGAQAGQQNVDGFAYLQASFGYGKVSDQWLYFGVVLIFVVGLATLTMIVTEIYNHGAFNSSLSIMKKPNEEEKKLNQALKERRDNRDTEKQGEESQLSVNACNFTWEKLNYTVPVKGGDKRLLHDVYGYCKPGSLTALMVSFRLLLLRFVPLHSTDLTSPSPLVSFFLSVKGSSGAGKTTLLDVLADRKSIGVISGDRLVNGKTFGSEFQRGCGYAEQQDIHDGTATLREALRFSAYLRQPAHVSKEEKDAWVSRASESCLFVRCHLFF